jgi:hypothetical protein
MGAVFARLHRSVRLETGEVMFGGRPVVALSNQRAGGAPKRQRPDIQRNGALGSSRAFVKCGQNVNKLMANGMGFAEQKA